MQLRSFLAGCSIALLCACGDEPTDMQPSPDGGVVTGMPGAGASGANGASGTSGAGSGMAGASGTAGAAGSFDMPAGSGGSAGAGSGSVAGMDGSDPLDGGAVDSGADGGPQISDGPAEVRFVGRVDFGDAAGPRFAWSGSGLVARFMGGSVAIDLSGGQEYTVLIDGELRPKLVPDDGVTLIADDLELGAHAIEVYRRTEASQGESQFHGFTFEGGELLPPTVAPSRRIEIVGDSISCGFGNEGADETCDFTPQTENHYQTYGAMAARALHAELSTIAWSGLGVVCNYGDDAQSCSMPLPSYYDRTLPNRGDSAWDFDDAPQVVIINLGTNDFSTSQDPSESEFTNAYSAFLMHIRSKYPDALILGTCGPMLFGAELDMVRSLIVNAVAATGDDNMGTFDIPSQSASDGLGCSYHPSITTHQKMADLVVAELHTRLGW